MDSETLLKWGGVGLVVLAVGFAVSTAISRNWIGPELQLAAALLVGFGLVAVGLRIRATRPGWTHALCSGGVIALLTTVASDLFLDQAPTAVAFVATAVIAAGGLVLARAIHSEWVAVATTIAAAIGWAVIGNGDASFALMTGWYVALIAVTISLALEQGWFASRVVADVTGMIALLALAANTGGASDQTVVLIATALLAGSLFIIPSIGDYTSVWRQLEVQLATATAPWAFTAAFAAVLDGRSDAAISSVAFSIAVVTAAAAVAFRARLRHPHVISLLLGASVTLSIGLAVLLSTSAVFVCLAIQAAGLVVLSRALDRNVRVMINAAVLATIAAVYVIVRTADAWVDNVRWADDLAHAAIVVALAVGLWQTGEHLVRRAGAVAVLGLTLLWLGSVMVHAPQGQALVSISWAALGTAVFVIGAVRRRADAAATGLAVLGLTVGKLLSVDLREVDTLWRAGLFFLVGMGLLRLGFLLPRLARSDDDEPADPEDPETPDETTEAVASTVADD